jgi:hypothetical protein
LQKTNSELQAKSNLNFIIQSETLFCDCSVCLKNDQENQITNGPTQGGFDLYKYDSWGVYEGVCTNLSQRVASMASIFNGILDLFKGIKWPF